MTSMIPAWIDGDLVPVEKMDAHLRGLRHKAVSVFVLRGDALLIQQRALCKYHTPGLWANTCCTHPLWDESGLDCANRRLDQELGITGLTLEQRDTLEYRADVGGDMIEHEVVEVFVGHVSEVTCTLNPDEVAAVRWIRLDDLRTEIATDPALFTPWLHIYMERHARQIFGEPKA